MSAQERIPQVPASASNEDLRPAPTGKKSLEAPRNSYRDWPLLRPHEWVPEVPVVNREEPAATLEKPGGSPYRRDEAGFQYGIAKEITPCLLYLERVLDTLAAIQEVSRHTRLNSRGTMMVP